MNAKKIDKIAISTLYVIAGIIVTILAALILYILVRGIPHISWSFLTSRSSSYKAGGGIGVQLYNSFFLLVITLIISVPLSMGAGIFLSEYAKKRTTYQLCPYLYRNPIFTTFSGGRTLRLFNFRCSISVWIFNPIRCLGLNCL